jgi:hypothetical protein
MLTRRKVKNQRAETAGAPPKQHPLRRAALAASFLAPWLLLGVMLARSPDLLLHGWGGRAAGLTGHGQPGPWGQLHWTEVELRAPERCTVDQCRTNLPQWFFEMGAPEEIRQFLSRSGCTDQQAAALLKTAQPVANGWQVSPSLDVLFGLPASTRAIVYSRLAESARNLDQVYAFRLPGEQFARWMELAQLEPGTIRLIEQLTYTDGRYRYLADESALYWRLSSDAEKLKLLEAFLRTKALLVRLHVGPEAKVMALAEYWGAHGRVREVLPILESVARLPGGGDVDIVNLLPPFADTWLNTYPRMNGPLYDCHWSAYNFFSLAPDNSLLVPGRIQKVYQEQYAPISAAEVRLGDLVLFINQAGEVVHTAVYIADDILFTKNGVSPKKPWVLMKMDDVKNTFWKMPTISFARQKSQA